MRAHPSKQASASSSTSAQHETTTHALECDECLDHFDTPTPEKTQDAANMLVLFSMAPKTSSAIQINNNLISQQHQHQHHAAAAASNANAATSSKIRSAAAAAKLQHDAARCGACDGCKRAAQLKQCDRCKAKPAATAIQCPRCGCSNAHSPQQPQPLSSARRWRPRNEDSEGGESDMSQTEGTVHVRSPTLLASVPPDEPMEVVDLLQREPKARGQAKNPKERGASRGHADASRGRRQPHAATT